VEQAVRGPTALYSGQPFGESGVQVPRLLGEICLKGRAMSSFVDFSVQKVSGVHISDLTALYGLIVERVLRRESLPSGREGYYFALAHDIFLGEVGDHLASELRDRGVTTNSEVRRYSDDKLPRHRWGFPHSLCRCCGILSMCCLHVARMGSD
jgi:hypothetical protein